MRPHLLSLLLLTGCLGDPFTAGDPNALDGKASFVKVGDPPLGVEAGADREAIDAGGDAGEPAEASPVLEAAPEPDAGVDSPMSPPDVEAPDASPVGGDAGAPSCTGPIGTFSCTEWAMGNCSATGEALCCRGDGLCGCKTSQTVCR